MKSELNANKMKKMMMTVCCILVSGSNRHKLKMQNYIIQSPRADSKSLPLRLRWSLPLMGVTNYLNGSQ